MHLRTLNISIIGVCIFECSVNESAILLEDTMNKLYFINYKLASSSKSVAGGRCTHILRESYILVLSHYFVNYLLCC